MTASSGNTPDPSSGLDIDVPTNGFSFKGLKKYVAPPAEKPFDPFGGWTITPQLYVVQDDYDVPLMTTFKTDPDRLAGGYDPQEAYSRALCDAFSGFAIFLDEEIPARENGASGDGNVGTQAAAAAAVTDTRDVNMDDIF